MHSVSFNLKYLHFIYTYICNGQFILWPPNIESKKIKFYNFTMAQFFLLNDGNTSLVTLAPIPWPQTCQQKDKKKLCKV